jgi:hypothetical protein
VYRQKEKGITGKVVPAVKKVGGAPAKAVEKVRDRLKQRKRKREDEYERVGFGESEEE